MIFLLVNVQGRKGNKQSWVKCLLAFCDRWRFLRSLKLLGKRQRPLVQAGQEEDQSLSQVKVSNSVHYQMCRKSPNAMEGGAMPKQLEDLNVWVTSNSGA